MSLPIPPSRLFPISSTTLNKPSEDDTATPSSDTTGSPHSPDTPDSVATPPATNKNEDGEDLGRLFLRLGSV